MDRNTLQLAQKSFRTFYRYTTPKKLFNLCLVKLEKKATKTRLLSRPYKLNIDVTNFCNLKCSYCKASREISGRKKQSLPYDSFKTILDKLSPYLYTVNFYNWGEPLLNEDIFEMIKYASHHKIGTSISTNLNYFKPEYSKKLITAKLQHLFVSLDSLDTKTYSKHKKGGDLNKVIKNLKSLVLRKRKLGSKTPRVVLQLILFKYNAHEVSQLKGLVKQLGLDGYVIQLGYGINEIEPLEADKSYLPLEQRDKKCNWLWETLTVNADGNVAPCCIVFDRRYDVGNILQNDLGDVWNCNRLAYLRSLWKKNNSNIKNNTPCIDCNRFQKNDKKFA